MTSRFSLCALLLAAAVSVSAQTTSYANGARTQEGPTNYCGVDSGVGNAYVCANPAGARIQSYRAGVIYYVTASHANTGAATLSIDGLSAISIKKQQGSGTLSAGDITANAFLALTYDPTGNVFQLQTPVPTAGGTGNGSVTSVGIGATPSWLSGSVSNPSTTPTLSLSSATGQTSHQVIGTCGTGTSFGPCALTASDLPTGYPYASLTGTPTLGSAAAQNISAFDPAGAASNALATAQSYASNASNLTSGTVSSALLPATVVGQAPYSQTFTSQISVVLTHPYHTTNVLTQCFDGGSHLILPNTLTVTDADHVTVTFSQAQTGFCVVNGAVGPTGVGGGGGTGNGSVTTFSVAATPAWLSGTVANASSTPALTIAAATGQTSHQVLGTCGSATSFGPCALTTADLPASLIGQAPYSQSFSAQTSIVLAHNYNTSNVLVQCYDASNHQISPSTVTITDANNVTVTFGVAQSGRCVVNGAVGPSGAGGLTNPMIALGDVLYGGASGTPARLTGNSANTKEFMTETAASGVPQAPSWAQVFLSDVGGAKANTTFANSTYNLTFSTTNATYYTIQNQSAATGSANQSSPILSLCGSGWEGSVTPGSATDCWTFQDLLVNGSNPTPTLKILNTGSSTSAAIVSVPALSSSSTISAVQFSGPLTGNVTGNAATASALAATPAGCTTGQFAIGIAASGAANCSTVYYTQISGTPSIPSAGIVKSTGSTYTAAAFADVVALFGSGSCSGYLKSDGTCSTQSSGLTSLNSPNSTITIGGTLTAPTLDVNPAAAVNHTAVQSFSAGFALATTGTQPTCASANRGLFWYIQGTTDHLQVCTQSNGTYSWLQIF